VSTSERRRGAATFSSDRTIALVDGLFVIPERLLLAHARGEVLFITGAGISRPSGLPDFRQLVLRVYERLDVAAHAVLRDAPRGWCRQWTKNLLALKSDQRAEVTRFVRGDYDVVLGMLERRMDGPAADRAGCGRRSTISCVIGAQVQRRSIRL
jgi:hypothetical protein